MAPVKPMGIDEQGRSARTVTGFKQDYNETPSEHLTDGDFDDVPSRGLDPAHTVDLVTPANEQRDNAARASQAPVKTPKAKRGKKR